MRKIALAIILLAFTLALAACDDPARPSVLLTAAPAGSTPSPAILASPEKIDPAGPATPLPGTIQAAANTAANLRAGPGTTFAVVGSARPGEPLHVVARNAAGDWLQLAGGQWIFAELVSGGPNLPVAQAPGAPATAPPPSARAPSQALTVTVIDVGQGDSILIQAPGGHNALIDGGMAGTGALAYLQRHGIDRLDLVVATHAHADHVGGLTDVLRVIPVAEVATNGQALATSDYQAFVKAARAARATLTEVSRGDTLPLGDLALAVLSPATIGPAGDPNHNSLVLRLDYGGTGFQFQADADQATEDEMLAAGVLRPVTVLKVGHHGGSSSSGPAFLAAVRPKVAVYSAMPFNPYGYPHEETTANLGAVGAQIYGTDRDGSVTITSDGAAYHVTPERAPAPVRRPRFTTC